MVAKLPGFAVYLSEAPCKRKNRRAGLKSRVQFAEIGEGNLDMKAIIDLAGETGVEHIFIEQDDTYGRDPFESLEISANNLRKLGFEDRF